MAECVGFGSLKKAHTDTANRKLAALREMPARHSTPSTVTGSTSSALRAGIRQATSATQPKKRLTNTNVGASVGATSNSIR